MTDGIALGVDIGGSKIRVTLQDTAGRVLAAVRVETPSAGSDAVVHSIVDAVQRMDHRAAVVCGVGTAGDVDHVTGRISWASSTIRDWNGYPLGERLSPRLGIPVFVENDGNAAAFAEATVGAGRDATSVLAVFVGTGIGGGIVIDGRVLHGAHGRAGEIGHTDAAGAGEAPCPCGGYGHIESAASATAVEREHGARSGGAHVPYAEIGRRAEAGDALAIRVLGDAGRQLARWLPSVIAVLDPGVVVVGGGALGAAAYLDAFNDVLARQGNVAFPSGTAGGVDIRISQLGEDAVAVGAAALARSRLGQQAS